MNVLPAIGLGTSQNDDAEQCASSVATALELGYRHVDTAQLYGNESHVGEGIARADVPREAVTVATKVHEDRNAYDAVLESVEGSRERLGLQTIDLLYVHFPIGDYTPEETLPAFDKLRDDGIIEHVGVSNFSPEQVDEAVDVLDAPLVANQVEMHPLLPPRDDHLRSAREHGYQLVAYSPFCRGRAFDLEPVETVSEKHGVSKAQAILAWLLSYDNVVTIPKATGADHLRDNLAAQELTLDAEDIALIESVDERYRKFDRAEAPWNQ